MNKQTKMKMVIAAAWICAAPLSSFADVKVERSPLGIGSYVDIGQIVKGGLDPSTSTSPDGAVLQRTAVYLYQTTTIEDRFAVKVGVGGLFYYSFPEIASNVNSRTLRFGPGVGEAEGIYKLGDLNKPTWTIQFGYFPYKYNPDAKDLGEYLLRDGTYPGYEVTGMANWSFINSALYMASGLRVNGSFLDGKLSADLNVFIERDIEPNHDLSPSVVLNYKPTEVLDFGAGAEFAHLISFTPSILKGRQYYIVGDSAYDGGLGLPLDSVKRFTFQGVKLMARASANFGAILNNPWIGKEGLKLYTEAAILGVQDYPVYYNRIWQRVPVTVGLNLPTLNFFDVLSFEYEYRRWANMNSTNQVVANNYPYWNETVSDIYGGNVNREATKAQDNKWAVYLKKTIVPGISIYAQAASDWIRGVDQNNVVNQLSITQRPSQWYYMFRLEFGI